MKITRGQLRRIILEVNPTAVAVSMAGAAPTSATAGLASSSNPGITFPATCPSHACTWGEGDESDAETLEEDDKEEAEMKITKEQLRRIIKEEKAKLLSEAMNPAMVEIENELRHTLAEYIDTYMMSMNMNPGDPADRQRVSRRVDDIVSTIIGN